MSGNSGVPANVDARFQYRAQLESRGGVRQNMYNTEVSYIEPTNVLEEVNRQIDFDITTKRPVLFEHNTKMQIAGCFQQKAIGDAAVWTNSPAAEYANVQVSPVFWEDLLRSPGEVFNNHQLLKTSDEPSYVPFALNKYIYWSMEPTLKKILAPEACHPINGIPQKAKSWNWEADGEWKKYADTIFTGAEIKFTWVPLFVFPFYQGSNWIVDKVSPGCVPINHLGKFTYRLTFKDNQDCIFRKKNPIANTKSYRFLLTRCKLMVEEVRMNPALERSLYQTSKKTLCFPGVTKLATAETVPTGVYTHNVRFESIYMPEGIFIFALNKKVVGGTYKFSDMGAADFGPLFSAHNMIDTNVEFAGVKLALTEPNQFQVNKDVLDLKVMLDHMGPRSPFGILTDPDKFTLASVTNGFAATDFPHVYYNLCVGSGSDRMVPALTEDAGLVNKIGDLILQLKFGREGAPADLIYVVYIYYTDVNMMLDLRNKRFSCAYALR